MSGVDIISVHRLAVPLVKPYHLAFGTVEQFETLVVEAATWDDRIGLGEATVLTGYTDESIDECWEIARRFAQSLTRCDLQTARSQIADLAKSHPFTATAFGTAIEMAQGSPLLKAAGSKRIPLVGLLDGEDETTLGAETERLLEGGYRTLKFKVGFDPDQDAARVKIVQRAVRGRAMLRIDANQGYSAAQGIAFVRAVDPEGIELFEQPCPAGDWDSHVAVANASNIPLMLDESIYGIPDIETAADLRCATFIKVKLMKLGSLEALVNAIQRIRDLGMKPVLGNGVACDLGCWLEAMIAAHYIDNAGEMNGFLKASSPLLVEPLSITDGALHIEDNYIPRIDSASLVRYGVDSINSITRSAL